MKRLVGLLTLFGLVFGLSAASDNHMCSMMKGTLKSMNINVLEVKIADGTAKGGERCLMISFITNSNPKRHLTELVQILESGHTLNKNMNARIDSVMAIAGNRYGKTRGIIVIKASDANWFISTKNSEGYLKRWKVLLDDSTYLSSVSSVMGWKNLK